MRVCIVSDRELLSTQIRELLLREGQDCPAADVLSLSLAAERLATLQPELLLVVLSPAPETALTVLEDLRLLTAAPILVVGPAGDPQLILRALHTGARDYIDETDLENGVASALLRIRAESSVLGELGRTICLLAPSGGSGSSTLAVNLAVALAQEHRSTALFDLKLHSGDLGALLDLKPAHTLAELCQNTARMDRVMFERSLVRHSSGVYLLAPPRHLADAVHVTPEGVHQALRLARNLFPYIVIDLDHTYREEQLQVLREADLTLVVLRLDFTCLCNTHRALEYLAQLGMDPERMRLVVNRYGQPREVPATKAEEALGLKIYHYVPDEPKTVNRANNNGVPVLLESPRASVSRSLVKLAAGVTALTGTPPSTEQRARPAVPRVPGGRILPDGSGDLLSRSTVQSSGEVTLR